MAADFESVFALLKPVLGKQAKRLSVNADTATEYTLVGKTPSRFPQHKGQSMFFGSVRLGRAYVSFHLMPLYMNPALTKTILSCAQETNAGRDVLQLQDRAGSGNTFRTGPAHAGWIQIVQR